MAEIEQLQFFSQCGEDFLILNLIRGSLGSQYDFTRFRYVDIGACHPVEYSNTHLFYQLGAKGLLVEPNPELTKLIHTERPRDVCIEGAANFGGNSDVTILHRTDSHFVSSANEDFLDEFIESKNGKLKYTDTLEVQVIDLNQSINEVMVDADFGLLSIDTEGFDLEVLRQLDLNKRRPWFIILEPSVEIVGNELSKEMDQYLSNLGYEKVARTRVNSIYKDLSLKSIHQQTNLTNPVGKIDKYVKQRSSEFFELNTKIEKDESYVRVLEAINDAQTTFVSFDVFDTALLRPVLEPHDLFLFLDQFVREELSSININFSQQRRLSERKLRLAMKEQGATSDPTIKEIYEQFCADLAIDFEDVQGILAAEVDIEKSATYANPAVLDLYHEAISAGKKVIFCSDSYLDSGTLKEMLVNAGYQEIDSVFSSCELGAAKKFGTFFPKILELLGVKSREILHIGDNRISDDINAKKSGIRTIRIIAPRDKYLNKSGAHRSIWANPKGLDLSLRCSHAVFSNRYLSSRLKGEPEQSLFNGSHEQFGYYAVGPFLYWLLNWMRREAKVRQIDHIFFLARDGYLPLQAWKILFENDDNVPSVSYLLASRRSFLPISMHYGNYLSALNSIKTSPSLSISKFLSSRLPENLVSQLTVELDQIGINPAEPIRHHETVLHEFLVKNKKTILNHVQQDAINAKKYLSEKIKPFAKPALFDVGRKGTFQNIISRLIKSNIFGFYVLTEGQVTANIDVESFLAAFPQTDRKLHPNEPDTIIYEILFSSTGESVLGWDKNGAPIFDPTTAPTAESSKIVKEIQKGALLYLQDIRMQLGKLLDDEPQNTKSANYLISKFWTSEADLGLFDELTHEDSISNERRMTLADYYGISGSRRAIGKRSNGKKHLVIYCPAMTRIKGGIERVVSVLSYRFVKIGYHVTILTDGNLETIPRPVYPIAEGCDIFHIRARFGNEVAEKIGHLSPDALLVLASGPVVSTFANVTEKLGIPLMLSERAEPYAAISTYWGENKEKEYLQAYGKADQIAVQLSSFKRVFAKRFEDKLVVLHNPIRKISAAVSHGRKNTIVCVGRINTTQKRQGLLLEAFALIAEEVGDWELHFYGSCLGQEIEELKNRVKELGLVDRVSFFAPVDDIDKVYASASILAMPSRFEGFPNVLAEALSSGLPAVGFRNCPGVNELIIHNKNGLLVEEDTPQALASSMRLLCSDKEKRLRFGQQAIEIFSENYSSEATLHEWERAVEKLLSIKKAVPVRNQKWFKYIVRTLDPRFWFLKSIKIIVPMSEDNRWKLLARPHSFFADCNDPKLRPLRLLFRHEADYL